MNPFKYLSVVIVACVTAAVLTAYALQPSQQSFFFKLTEVDGNMNEVCLPMTAGYYLIATTDPLVEIELNVHRHIGNDVVYPIRENIRSAISRPFSINSHGEYCVMVMNRQHAPRDHDINVVVMQSDLQI